MIQSAIMRSTAWTPFNITLMVIGFVLFWPLGLAMLAYILWGDRFRAHFEDFKRDFTRTSHHGSSGNVAFDEYRARELERLEEERRRLDEERREFAEFVDNLRRAKDQEEFERYMSGRNQNGATAG